MKVRMLKNTYFEGPKKSGEEYEIPSATGNMWAKRGICMVVEEEKFDAGSEEESGDEFSDMTVKELYALCIERGFEVEMKKPKAYYIEFLTAGEKPEEEKEEEESEEE